MHLFFKKWNIEEGGGVRNKLIIDKKNKVKAAPDFEKSEQIVDKSFLFW